MQSPAISVKKICKSFGTGFAIRDLSFEVHKAEIVGILGPNGAGKTTTIRMLISALLPDSGEIWYGDSLLSSNRTKILQQVGFGSAYTGLPLYLTVEESLTVQGYLYGMKRVDIKSQISRLLGLFSATSLRGSLVNSLSAGQRTRVILVKAFLHRPSVVLLDEPTASLDPDIAIEIREFIKEQKRSEGVAVLVSSHNMHEVSTLCDRVVFLRDGEKIADDTPHRLALEQSRTRVEIRLREDSSAVADFLKQQGIEIILEKDRVEFQIETASALAILADLKRFSALVSSLTVTPPDLTDFFLYHSKSSDGGGR